MYPKMKHLYDIWFTKHSLEDANYEELRKGAWGITENGAVVNLKNRYPDDTITIKQIKKVF